MERLLTVFIWRGSRASFVVVVVSMILLLSLLVGAIGVLLTDWSSDSAIGLLISANKWLLILVLHTAMLILMERKILLCSMTDDQICRLIIMWKTLREQNSQLRYKNQMTRGKKNHLKYILIQANTIYAKQPIRLRLKFNEIVSTASVIHGSTVKVPERGRVS